MADFDVVARLMADASGFTAGISDAKSAIESLPKSTSQAMNQVGSAMQSVGKGMTTFITAPIVAGVTTAIKSYADLEQAIGGIETMFKGSASTVISNSESAYKRAGVSGVDYMEQVTSFSATLLQGLGGDTVKAAEYADKAIVDMSDNANKFGTNINEIQRAYQGFAKDNFTMLDNLKLGYGGTAGEMARLVNESGVLNDEFEATAENVKDIPFDVLIEAIHQTQKELGVTGTTALEASETVSGSFGAMVAAAKNLVAGFGDVDADIGQLMSNLGETVKIFVGNIKRVLGTMWDNLPLAEWQKWVGLIIVSAGPMLFIFGKLISALSQVGMAVKILGAAFAFLTSPIGLVIAAIMAVVGVIIYLWNTNEEFRTAVTEIWNSIVETATELWNQLKSSAETIWGAIKETWEAVWAGIQAVWEAFKGLFSGDWSGFWNSIVSIGEGIWNVLSGAFEIALGLLTAVFGFFKGLFTGDWETFWDGLNQTADGIWQALGGLWETATGLLTTVWEGFKALLEGDWEGFWNTLKDGANTIWGNMTTLWDETKEKFGTTWEGIKEKFADWEEHWNNLKETAGIIWDAIVELVGTWLTNIGSKITEAMPTITEAWTNIWNGFTEAVQAIWDGIVEGVGGFMGNIKDKITEIGEGIAEAWNTFWGGLGEKASGAWDNISEGWTNFWGSTEEQATTGSTNVSNAFETMGENVRGSSGRMSEGAQQSATELNAGVSDAISATASNVESESRQIEATKEFYANLQTAAVQSINTMRSQIEFAFKIITNRVESETVNMTEKVKQEYESMSDNIGSIMDNTVSMIQNAMSSAVSAMNSAAGQAQSAGANMGFGFYQGLNSMAGSIYALASSIASNAAAAMRSALSIFSPSRVTREIGEYTGEGLVLGLEDMLRPVEKTAKLLAESATPTFSYSDLSDFDRSINSMVSTSIHHTSDVVKHRGEINNRVDVHVDLTMGKHSYRGFVSDISAEQQAQVRMAF